MPLYNPSGGGASLTKATGAEINTGSNDTHYVTPKAIADSSGVRMVTTTVDTDPDNFLVIHTFDLGRVATFQLKMTLLTLDADGETFGRAPGEFAIDLRETHGSFDGIEWVTLQAFLVNFGDGLVTVNDTCGVAALTNRYVRFKLAVHDYDSGDIYAGANNPTGHVQMDVTYA